MVDISIDQLSAEITGAVREYTEDVSKAIAEKVDKTADLVLQEVKATAPVRTGEYAKGFVKTSADTQGKTRRIIWNKKHYRLVHLLEFGHAKRNGGRVSGRPHMRPAYEKYGAQLPDHIKRIIQNGGGE